LRILVVPIGEVDRKILNAVRDGLCKAFTNSFCLISERILHVPKSAYVASRGQYLSTRILDDTSGFAAEVEDVSSERCHVLGVAEVDLYVPGLNFVFGEARCPGNAAVISLHRLRPEFYGVPPDETVFLERAVKEAVHELGHTFGLRHCPNPACVMHFSLHIGMTDLKQAEFCDRCQRQIAGKTGNPSWFRQVRA
jgi:archaemetzincin